MTQSGMRQAQTQEMHRVLHDLSNTLTGLLMNAGLLSLALRSNERLRRYADDIHESATASAELLRRIRMMLEGAEVECEVTDQCDVRHKTEHEILRSKAVNGSTRTH